MLLCALELEGTLLTAAELAPLATAWLRGDDGAE
jgi:hypothetical protein